MRRLWTGCFVLALLACAAPRPARATEIDVRFDRAVEGNFLRLNMGSNGWTNANLSQYYDDLSVRYRRMDHWNNFFDPIRRRPDGGLWFDYWELDHAIYEGTGGFRTKAYPTVDYSPACFTTDFLRNPLDFDRQGCEAQLTPAGTVVIAGRHSHANQAAQIGLFEINRKGIVVWRGDYHPRIAVTPSNWLVVDREDGTFEVLDAARKPIAEGRGQFLQQVGPMSLLVRQDQSVKQTKLDGSVEQEWKTELVGQPVVLTRRGLVEVATDSLLLHAAKETQMLLKLDVKFNHTQLAANDAGRLLIGYGTYTDHWAFGGAAWDEEGNPLWKHDDLQADAMRGAAVTSSGNFILAAVGPMGVSCFDAAGELVWRANDHGAMSAQLVTSPGMETLKLRAYDNTVSEYDVRTGKIVWQYANVGDQSAWITTPPQDLAGWEESIYRYLKHYNKDIGVGWDRWELWNEPGPNGYFWKGGHEQYGELAAATMKGVERGDPSVHMDLYAGDWLQPLVEWLQAHPMRVDGLTYHGYEVAFPNQDFVATKGKQAGEFAFWASQLPGKKTTVGDSEWNLHPGHGDDLSKSYETGYYRAPFQSEMIKLKGDHGVSFSSQFCMSSEMSWPSGWVYTTPHEIAGHQPPAGGQNVLFSPAYNAAKLWSMLPDQKAELTCDFPLQPVKGTSHRVSGVAAGDPQRGQFALLAWNFSNQSTGAKDETVSLTAHFPAGTGPLTMRHYAIDEAHSTYTAGWDKQWLECVETKPVSGDVKLEVTLKKDSLHGFYFSKAPLKAACGKVAQVEVNQPVQFDGRSSTGMPANYHWDFDAADGVDFPVPDAGPPSPAHGYGATPILAHGYARPGKYKVTLQVSADGYDSAQDRATTTVVVVADKTVPPTPVGLTADAEATDREVYLQWDSPPAAAFADVAGYNVYRQSGGKDWRKITAAPLEATAYVDAGLAFGTKYNYRVAAVDASGNESAPSREAAAAPQRVTKKPKSPVALKASIPGGDLVVLTWDNLNLAAGARVAGFHVYRRVAGSGEFQKITPHPTVYKMYYDDVKNAGLADKYEYTVSAISAFGNESVQSAPCKAVP